MFKKILKYIGISAVASLLLLTIVKAGVSDPMFFRPEGDSLVATWLNKLGNETHPIEEINTNKLTVNTDISIGTAEVGVGGLDMNGETIKNAGAITTTEINDGVCDSTDEIDFSAGSNHISAVQGECTYTFVPPTGNANLLLRMVWGGYYNITLPTSVVWSNGQTPMWDTQDTHENYAFLYWNGLNYIGTAVTGIVPVQPPAPTLEIAYWVGGSGENNNWSNQDNWALTSGGEGGAGIPATDYSTDVHFDANSGDIYLDNSANIIVKSLDFTGYAGTITASDRSEQGGWQWYVKNDVTFSPTMTDSTGYHILWIAGTSTVDANGLSLSNTNLNTVGGDEGLDPAVTLGSDIIIAGLGSLKGSFDTDGYDITTGNWYIGSGSEDSSWTLNDSVITTGGIDAFNFNFNGGGLSTLDAGTSTVRIVIPDTGQTSMNAQLSAGLDFNNFEVVWDNTSQYTTFMMRSANGTGNGTIAHLILDDTKEATQAYTFNQGETFTIGQLTLGGTSSVLTKIDSNNGTDPFTFSVASGVVSADYLNLKNSTATGGATFYAGANSTDGGGNTGWSFTAP